MLLIPLERPIAFHPELARLFGVNGALLLQQLLYWTPRGRLDDGWIYKTQKDIEWETTLTRTQQENCTKILLKAGVVETKIARVDGSTIKHFRVVETVLQQLILDNVSPAYSDGPECRKPATRNAGNLHSIYKNRDYYRDYIHTHTHQR